MGEDIRRLLDMKRHELWCVGADATVSQAAHRMSEKHVGTLIVLADNHAVGMVCERDIVLGVIACDKNPDTVSVADIMRSAQSISPQTSLENALKFLVETTVRQVLVVEDGRLLGVVSSKELMSSALQDRAFQISDLFGYITGRGGWHADPMGRTERASAEPALSEPVIEFDEPPELEQCCAICGADDDDPDWELGVARCRSCLLIAPTGRATVHVV